MDGWMVGGWWIDGFMVDGWMSRLMDSQNKGVNEGIKLCWLGQAAELRQIKCQEGHDSKISSYDKKPKPVLNSKFGDISLDRDAFRGEKW